MTPFFLRVFHHEQGLREAIRDLNAGRHRHDVLEAAIRTLELDPSDESVGFGGAPNLLGQMELDGAFMDGDGRACGAVAGMTRYLPVRVARKLMETQLHTLLVGAGAELFAREAGLPEDQTLAETQRARWEADVAPRLSQRSGNSLMQIVEEMTYPKGRNADTTVMIASDGRGISAASSTSGWAYKHPGRVGDTPIFGAGLYVDSRYGGACCTHTGEMAMRGAVAHGVVSRLAAGETPREAVRAAIDDLATLKGGVQRTLVVYAIDRQAQAYAAVINPQTPVYYQYWRAGMEAPERRECEPI